MNGDDIPAADLSGQTLVILGGNNIPSKRRLFDAARRRGLRILLVKEDATWEKEYCDEFLPLTVNNYQDFDSTTEQLVRFCERNQVNGITTTHDSAIPILAQAVSILGLNGPSPEAAAALRNKEAMRQRFAELGVPSAMSVATQTLAQAQAAAEEIGYPVVVKPSVGTASAGVVLVHNVSELTAAFETSRRVGQSNNDTLTVLIEEYLEGMEVTVDALVYDGEILFHNISDHPQPMPGPHFAQIEFVTPTQADAELARRTYEAHAIAIDGFGLRNNIVHTEMRLTSRGPRLIELHPRPAGQRVPEITARSWGVDLMGAAIEIAVGHRPAIYPQRNGYAGYRCICPSRSGWLRAIHGVEQARVQPGIFDIEVTIPVGSPVFTVPESNQQDVVYVYGHGDTYAQARTRTEAADNMISLEIV